MCHRTLGGLRMFFFCSSHGTACIMHSTWVTDFLNMHGGSLHSTAYGIRALGHSGIGRNQALTGLKALKVILCMHSCN
ncbi:hypothetical protein C7974DRAFT_227127 [Boeremia exigua]|uniref:uncharacterized protein n=1 Tax=Boeremia exigua TaxID=749465 RepID=UPI001E8DA92E|nr:uncharacterized protein C7974DRAFT_227127 [Boeremia exigua]KAH6620148.1 hypothetical protein C7974DRAFT_227127 [Boeremia exigua]